MTPGRRKGDGEPDLDSCAGSGMKAARTAAFRLSRRKVCFQKDTKGVRGRFPEVSRLSECHFSPLKTRPFPPSAEKHGKNRFSCVVRKSVCKPERGFSLFHVAQICRKCVQARKRNDVSPDNPSSGLLQTRRVKEMSKGHSGQYLSPLSAGFSGNDPRFESRRHDEKSVLSRHPKIFRGTKSHRFG